ncbi:MAG: efflux RND transporter periplasmic adaptor subunit [Acidobacteriota bacterium]
MRRLAKPKVLIPLAVVVLFLLGGWTLRNKLAADRQGNWVRVKRGDLVTGFEVSGSLASMSSENLGPPQLNDVWEFKISMLAPEGADVKRGQPVVGFDTTELQRRLDEKSAESDQARKQIEKERADLSLGTKGERMKLAEAEARLRKASLKLDTPGDIVGINERKTAEIEYGIARRETASARTRLDALEAAARARIGLLQSKQQQAALIVAETQDSIRQMMRTAPRDGTVVYSTNWRGEKKKTGDNTWRGERIVEIPDLTRMMAEGEVDEADAGRVVVGQRVILRLDAHPDEEIHGTITKAGRTVQQKRGTQDPMKVLRVDIALDKTDPASMRPGMRFQGTIELGRVKSALLIPREAVFVSGEGTVVYRRGTLEVITVPVRLGRQNADSVEVLSGVSPGDRILVPKENDGEEKS